MVTDIIHLPRPYDESTTYWNSGDVRGWFTLCDPERMPLADRTQRVFCTRKDWEGSTDEMFKFFLHGDRCSACETAFTLEVLGHKPDHNVIEVHVKTGPRPPDEEDLF